MQTTELFRGTNKTHTNSNNCSGKTYFKEVVNYHCSYLYHSFDDPIVIPESTDNCGHSDEKRLAPPLDLLELLQCPLLKNRILMMR